MPVEPDLSGFDTCLSIPVYNYHQYQKQTNNCGPTSLAIAANSILGEERFCGDVVADDMNKIVFELRPVPHIVVRRIPNWATFPWGIVHYLKQHGFSARWSLLGNMDKLLDNIRANIITITIIGEPLKLSRGRYTGWAHAKILFAHKLDDGYLFVDPAMKKQAKNPPQMWSESGLTWQKEDEFLKQWKGMMRIYIEVPSI